MAVAAKAIPQLLAPILILEEISGRKKILIGRLKDFMIKTQRPVIPTLNIPDNETTSPTI
jgi:hypothetical protein